MNFRNIFKGLLTHIIYYIWYKGQKFCEENLLKNFKLKFKTWGCHLWYFASFWQQNVRQKKKNKTERDSLNLPDSVKSKTWNPSFMYNKFEFILKFNFLASSSQIEWLPCTIRRHEGWTARKYFSSAAKFARRQRQNHSNQW